MSKQAPPEHAEIIEFTLNVLELVRNSGMHTACASSVAFTKMEDWLKNHLNPDPPEDYCGELSIEYCFGDSEYRQTRSLQWAINYDSFKFDHTMITCCAEMGSESTTFLSYAFDSPHLHQIDGWLEIEGLLEMTQNLISQGADVECHRN